MPPTPVLLKPGISGLPLSGNDYNSNWATVENSFLDTGPWIISGLAISAGAGLSVAVAAGVAVIGAEMVLAGFSIGSLTPSQTNHLYLQQNGLGTANTTGIAPAKSVKLGTCVTGASTVTSVNMGRTSGRQQFRQPQDLIPGGPSAGTASAGHPDALNLANWNATDAEGKSCYGVLPAGAVSPTFRYPLVSKSANYTVTTSDYYVLGDATGGAFTLTLPDATVVGAGGLAQPFKIKKIDATANAVNVASVAGQTFDGAASPFAITVAQTAYEFVPDGANWRIF